MLHVIAQKFGHQLDPFFLSGCPSERGIFIGANPAFPLATGREPAPAQGEAEDAEHHYSDCEIAYQTGYEGFMRYGEKVGSFEAAEPSLREEYEHRLPSPDTDRPIGTATALAAANAHLLWDQARHAARTAWKRAARQLTPRRWPRAAA